MPVCSELSPIIVNGASCQESADRIAATDKVVEDGTVTRGSCMEPKYLEAVCLCVRCWGPTLLVAVAFMSVWLATIGNVYWPARGCLILCVCVCGCKQGFPT